MLQVKIIFYWQMFGTHTTWSNFDNSTKITKKQPNTNERNWKIKLKEKWEYQKSETGKLSWILNNIVIQEN